MATFNEIYQSYLQNPYAGDNAIAPVQGIGSLQAQPSIAYSGDGTTTAAPTTTGKGIGSISMADVGKAIGFAMNPVMGIANMAVQGITGKSIAQQIAEAVQSVTGGGYGGKSSGYGVDSMAGMTSGPTHGVDAANEASVGADASAGGAAGAAAASAAGSNDGPGGGTFAKGGIVSLYG